ncbi:MAG: acetylxylan esterase [Chloroflexota bacterium]|nr:acetylxylan esterase [Chloroflexota bacterium]
MRGRASPRRLRRVLVGAAVVVLLLVALLAATHPGRVAVKSLLLLPSAIEAIPVDPLRYVTPSPRRESFAYDYAAGTVEGDIYAPGTEGRHGALILILGARPLDRDEPTLVRFAEGLSRAGAAVMIPASSALATGRVLPEEVDAVVRAVELLRARDDVDPDRIGILGFSVGGSVAVVAAGDPRLAGRLAFVNAFGSYSDSRDLVRAVATRSLAYAGIDEPWEPHPLTVWVLARQLADTLPDPTDREILDRIYLQEDATARDEVDRMTPVGRAALGLLDGLPPAEAEVALAMLPEATQERLRGISPSLALDRVTARLFIMHDLGDHFIPYTESRRMAQQAPPAILGRYTEFGLFDHVMPNKSLASVEFLVELGKLVRQLYLVLLYVL